MEANNGVFSEVPAVGFYGGLLCSGGQCVHALGEAEEMNDQPADRSAPCRYFGAASMAMPFHPHGFESTITL